MSFKKQVSLTMRIELRTLAAFTNWYELGQQASLQGANPGAFLKCVLAGVNCPPTYEERASFYRGYHDQPGIDSGDDGEVLQ